MTRLGQLQVVNSYALQNKQLWHIVILINCTVSKPDCYFFSYVAKRFNECKTATTCIL